MPAGTPVIIFSGVPSESAELERLRPRTRLVQKPYSLVMLVESLREMLAKATQAEHYRFRLQALGLGPEFAEREPCTRLPRL